MRLWRAPLRRRAAGAVPRGTALLLETLFLFGAILQAAPVSAQLALSETEDVRVVYVGGAQDYLLPHATRTFLNALQFHEKLFGFTPSEKISVLLLDLEDSGNASATAVPRNSLMVQVAPLNFAFETIAGNDRMNIIMNHELLHVVAMDQAAKPDRIWRRLFGGKVLPVQEQPESILYFFLTTPRVAAPRWYHEGAATFFDTWMAGGLGRAQSGYDEMVFRAMVKDGARFYDPLGLASEGTKIDFQLQINSYLYGTRFLLWLARTYSPEQVVEWVARHEGSRAYYAAQFRHVFGTTIERAWSRWIEDERAFQQQNLAAIRTFPVTTSADLTTRALGSVSRPYYDPATGKIYAAFNYPGVVAHLGTIDTATGTVERLVDIKGPTVYTVTSLARDPGTGILYYTTDNGAWRDLNAFDPATRKATLLQKDARIGDLAFSRADGALWGIRQLNGLCTLVRMAPPYRDWKQVKTFPYGTVVYDLDVSPDGTMLVASFGEISGKQNVRVLPVAGLLAGAVAPAAQFDFGTSVPNGFVFSPDGRFVYGSSYYTGVSNIFRYEIAAKKLDAVTNADTGFFRPIPLGGDDLIAFRYTGQGFVPTRLTGAPLEDVSPITFMAERVVEEHPVIKQWSVGSPARIDYDALERTAGVYNLAGGLRRESFYPIVQGYKDSAAYGLRLNLSDRLQLNRLSLTAAYSPDGALPSSERLHLAAAYDRYDWRARAGLNPGDFYDLFGPTKTSRKGYYAFVGHKTSLVYDEPRELTLDLSGSIAGNIDRLPEYQNVPVDVERLYTFDAALDFSDVRRSLGAVDDEAGSRSSAVLQGRVVDGTPIPKLYATWDRGFALPIGHSSVWFRSAGGYSPRDREQPFANFYFGGFGNNYVDHAEVKRYREYQAFPGAGLNEIGGRNFVKSMVEWNLPPWRFRRAGTPGLYATWMRPAVFVGGLAANFDDTAFSRELATVGGQVDFSLSALSALDVTLSVAGAVAVEQGWAPRRELMVSVKVLR
jgi:hypothetical protein